MSRGIDDTSKGARATIAELAKSSFANHRLSWDAAGHYWRCSDPKRGFHWFHVFTAPFYIVLWGDNGDVVLRVSDRDSLGWLLSASSLDYFVGKITACDNPGKEEFYPGDAKVYIDDMISQYPVTDDDGEEDEHNKRYVEKLQAVLKQFTDGVYDDDPARVWAEAWQDHIGDGDIPDLCGPSSTALWAWESVLTFRRLHAAGVIVDGVWTPPAADGTVSTGA